MYTKQLDTIDNELQIMLRYSMMNDSCFYITKYEVDRRVRGVVTKRFFDDRIFHSGISAVVNVWGVMNVVDIV